MSQSWLEITNRSDLGANLKAPQTDEKGHAYWSYSLIQDVKDGDRVLHYHKDEQAIVATSRAVGSAWADSIVWGARGSTARDRDSKPHVRPGWYLGLENFRPLQSPITLADLRSKETEIRHAIGDGDNSARYLPFAFSDKRPLRPSQGYLTRWPNEIDAVLGLASYEPSNPIVGKPLGDLGQGYVPANELAAVSTRDPFEVDPAIVERGIRSHAATQNALASFLIDRGVPPRSPSSDEPQYDLAWEFESTLVVAEVKSITPGNAERQLRLGLGQVLRYRHILTRPGFATVAVLVASAPPVDLSWNSTCESHRVVLVWPDQFHRLEAAKLVPTVSGTP